MTVIAPTRTDQAARDTVAAAARLARTAATDCGCIYRSCPMRRWQRAALDDLRDQLATVVDRLATPRAEVVGPW